MSRENILIVTSEFDEHTDAVIIKLRQMGIYPLRLHIHEFPTSIAVSLTQQPDGAFTGIMKTKQRVIDLATIKSVWWRRPHQTRIDEGRSVRERAFIMGEVDQAINGFWQQLECYWMSKPYNMRVASYKLEQLKRAHEFGFSVPKTLVTNDPSSVRDFFDICNGRMIYKTLSDPMLGLSQLASGNAFPEGEKTNVTLTTVISTKELDFLPNVEIAPCQFQELVDKQYELRVIVVGDEVFAAEIHSQENPRTQNDWRHYDVAIPYKRAVIPKDLEEQCLRFVRSYDLNYSAIDLIMKPDGSYVFLENNPGGQFLWVEHLVPELRLTDAVIACLVRGANATHI